MKINTTKHYPNDERKSRLYGTYLSVYDFNCTAEEFDSEKYQAIEDEKKGLSICKWFKDQDGKNIVADLKLKDKFVRIEIVSSGFRKIPKLSNKNKDAAKENVSSLEECLKYFTPDNPIRSPLHFVGREKQLKKAIGCLQREGGIITISGKRSIGKTSFANMMCEVCRKNQNLLKYYNLHNFNIPSNLTPIKINIPLEADTLENLLFRVTYKLNEFVQNSTSIIEEFKVNIPQFLEIRKTKSLNIECLPLIHQFIDILSKTSSHGVKPVLILDDFNYIDSHRHLPTLIRHLSGLGVFVILIGSEDFIFNLVEGDISISRHLTPINLDTLSFSEFQEIFYISNIINNRFAFFDLSFVESAYNASGGLPYFGHLFGYFSLLNKINIIKELDIYNNYSFKEKSITEVDFQTVKRSIKNLCQVYEELYNRLNSSFNECRDIINFLAIRGEVSLSDIYNNRPLNISKSRLLKWLNNSDTNRQISLSEDKVSLIDPIFRQFILISRDLIQIN